MLVLYLSRAPAVHGLRENPPPASMPSFSDQTTKKMWEAMAATSRAPENFFCFGQRAIIVEDAY
jgi:hypothetical protein